MRCGLSSRSPSFVSDPDVEEAVGAERDPSPEVLPPLTVGLPAVKLLDEDLLGSRVEHALGRVPPEARQTIHQGPATLGHVEQEGLADPGPFLLEEARMEGDPLGPGLVLVEDLLAEVEDAASLRPLR
jgi:hypothetical protein